MDSRTLDFAVVAAFYWVIKDTATNLFHHKTYLMGVINEGGSRKKVIKKCIFLKIIFSDIVRSKWHSFIYAHTWENIRQVNLIWLYTNAAVVYVLTRWATHFQIKEHWIKRWTVQSIPATRQTNQHLEKRKPVLYLRNKRDRIHSSWDSKCTEQWPSSRPLGQFWGHLKLFLITIFLKKTSIHWNEGTILLNRGVWLRQKFPLLRQQHEHMKWD